MSDPILCPDEEIVDLVNGYSLIQNKKLFRLGMDAILLADFASPVPSHDPTVCDLGTGNGAVLLTMAARNVSRETFLQNSDACKLRTSVKGIGVEVQDRSASLARRNISLNGLDDCLSVVQCDLTDIPKGIDSQLKSGSFRTVVCNPPYRKAGSGITAPKSEIEIARAEVLCTIEDVCRTAAYLLKWGGSFYCVHRPDRLTDLICSMRTAGVEAKTLRLVLPGDNTPPSMILVEGKLGAKPGITIVPPLVIYGPDGKYTPEVAAIYGMTNGTSSKKREG